MISLRFFFKLTVTLIPQYLFLLPYLINIPPPLYFLEYSIEMGANKRHRTRIQIFCFKIKTRQMVKQCGGYVEGFYLFIQVLSANTTIFLDCEFYTYFLEKKQTLLLLIFSKLFFNANPDCKRQGFVYIFIKDHASPCVFEFFFILV